MILAAGCAMALAAGAALAAPNPHATVNGDHSAQVELVAGGCGAGWHWSPGWRDRYGYWHRGHCVPN
jgi:hypothetical protein